MLRRNDSCEARVDEHMASRLDDLRTLWKLHCDDPEAYDDDLGRFDEYGLGFDYVHPFTFNGQRAPYFRYQLGWGGPSDEFRFYCDEDYRPVEIEYWFLDWFDGACRELEGKAFALLIELFDELTFGEPQYVVHAARS